jgi:AraC-like DNA-binding protein
MIPRAISAVFARPGSTMEWERLAFVVEFRPRELAKECGVSLRTLQRLFRTRYDLSVSEWLRAVRMREGYGRLRSGERIKAVAYSLGFKQLSHFSREFKKEFGVSPSVFRRSAFGGGLCAQVELSTRPPAKGNERVSFVSTVWNGESSGSSPGPFQQLPGAQLGAGIK